MASNFPKLPGYVPTHDPTVVCHKKVSHVKLEQIRNAKVVPVPLYDLPRPIAKNFMPEKSEMDKSLSHSQYICHLGEDKQELFEPTYVKLDKQVSPFSESLSDQSINGWAVDRCHSARFSFLTALISGFALLRLLQGGRGGVPP